MRSLTHRRICMVAAVLVSACGLLKANSHTLDTISYNFPLAGGGGGAAAQIDHTANIEIYCVDFNNDIFVPATDYSAYLTPITTAAWAADSSLAGQTRFGHVVNWTSVNATIDAATDLQRYQMEAYLISKYDRTNASDPNVNARNNAIQQAIWDILDPLGESASIPQPGSTITSNPNYNPQSWLTAAGAWLTDSSSGAAVARENFLASYRVVSDASKPTCSNALINCGFQEQITTVPEPRLLGLLLAGLLGIVVFNSRRFKAQA